MTAIFLGAGFAFAFAALYLAALLIRIARSPAAIYKNNQKLTGSFRDAACGLIVPAEHGETDYQVNHWVAPILDRRTGTVTWRRAGSLSDEAVDGVLARR